MTKRVGGFAEIKHKKLKVDDNIDHLWKDDSNIDDIDECLMLATQVCEQDGLNHQQPNNESTLSNYSIFKQDNKIFTSTQCNTAFKRNFPQIFNSVEKTEIINGNSYIKNEENIVNVLKMKIQELEEKYEAKEGEVSMLRTQLKEIKLNSEAEYQKKEQDWTEKLSALNKEIRLIKSELEFKNLEIANLRSKVSGISRAYATDNLLNNNQSITQEEISRSTTYLMKYKLEPVSDIKYPLMNSISSLIFNSGHSENFIINLKSSQINDFLVEDENDKVLDKYKKVTENKNFKLDNILSDISVIIRSSSLDINTKLCDHIDRIVLVSKCILSSFHNYLLNLECVMQNEDIRHEDLMYLEKIHNVVDSNPCIFDSRAWIENEVGIRARQTVGLIAELFPYSVYLQNMLLKDSIKQNNCDNYLNIINTIINIIGRIRQTDACEGFLCAVAILLLRISQTEEFCKCDLVILNISKELVFARPKDKVLKTLVNFFKQASVQSVFVNGLCKNSGLNLTTNNKEGIFYFNKDTCLLQVFVVLYQVNFIDKENVDIDICLSTLQFIMNILNCNTQWLFYQENNHCDCLCKTSMLGISVIHECLKKYKKDKDKIMNEEVLRQYNEILKFSIKVLHIISFKYFDIVNKYSVDSKYKFIVNNLLNFKDEIKANELECEALHELNIQEDICNEKSDDFDKIPIWK